MAITKDQFIQDAVNEIANYPTIAARYAIGDPMIMQMIAANAAQLASLSAQIDVTGAEPFTRARDVTVRADGAVKGILPFGTPTIASIKVTNGSSTALRVLVGRELLDQQGRYWLVTSGATVPAGGVGYVVGKQVKARTLTHTVTQSMPFYSIPVPGAELGYIADVAVANFEQSYAFANVLAGEQVFNIKSDEVGVISVQFGISNLAGYQPAVGESITVQVQDTEGEITLSENMKFAFRYAGAGAANQEAQAVLELAQVTQPGADPMDINTMREIGSYPAIYGDSAVYLSNFDYLVRKRVAPVRFLSVWNEAREEAVRGGSYENINSIFVAATSSGGSNDTLHKMIEQVIKRADSALRYRRREVVPSVMSVKLTLEIPSVYDSAAVVQQARTLMLGKYGQGSPWSQRGEAKMLEKDIYDLLRNQVEALNPRFGNLVINSISSQHPVMLPEHHRYLTDASLTIVPVEAEQWN
ncbi:hypothetical protein [Pseudomonas sp. GD03730]|uniref:hypothetical protein n=1 Tax=Pseudomonas sp. GD03730 TaxID=2975375 RepID=UPI00244791C5|nr:hypothetical protein [Pseudomonas sp. GD03730]MDH1403747.1 hypothetical protein [Pseudomonas sp. GD03730]